MKKTKNVSVKVRKRFNYHFLTVNFLYLVPNYISEMLIKLLYNLPMNNLINKSIVDISVIRKLIVQIHCEFH